MKGGKCALYPTWFWMTVLDTFRYTGMRNNQMIHIRLRDVNIEQGWIELRLEGSKTHRDDLLFDVKRFTNPRNTHYIYDEKNVLQSFRSFYRRLSRESGFDISSHRFRHTLATELMKSPDRNLKLVKDLLGHRNVSTTMEYIELDMEVAGKALEQELVLHTDITAMRNLQSLTQA